ncbi:MAG: DUF952 domain-containing protein [Anaerolineales bacterium]
MPPILHLASRTAWLAAVDQGCYRPDSLLTEGFIHCSKPAQIVEVANAFYHGQPGLVLLVIEPTRLTSELKWEAPSGLAPSQAHANDLFPHIYGPLNLEAVTEVIPFEPTEDGTFKLPASKLQI